MSLLRKRLSPSESVRWISASNAGGSGWFAQHGLRLLCRFNAVLVVALLVVMIVLWDKGLTLELASIIAVGLCLAVLFATYDVANTEVALLADHVTWNDRWLFKKDLPRVRLDSIDLIDVEEAADTVTLRCGDESHRLEEVAGGQVEQFARATGRPARIWRKCNSASANRARRMRRWTSLVSLALVWPPLYLLSQQVLKAMFTEPVPTLLETGVILAGVAISSVVAHFAAVTVPHLLAGRRLTGDDRRDFVCTIADPRWDGVQPDDPDDPWPGPFQRWAMRMAYGEVPVYRRWEPEIVDAQTGARQ